MRRAGGGRGRLSVWSSTGSTAAAPPPCPAAWSTPAAARRSSARRASPTRGRDVRLPERRGRGRRVGGHAPGVLRGQPGDAGLAGEPRRAVRGQPVPGQDLLPDEPALPLLLRQRTVRRRRRAARAARAPGPGPRHLGRAAVRPAGRGRPGHRRTGVPADRRRLVTGPTRKRPGHRRGVPDAARRAGLGPAAHRILHRWSVKPYLYVPGWAGSCTGRSAGWSSGTRGRYGWERPAAWCSRPGVSRRTGR